MRGLLSRFKNITQDEILKVSTLFVLASTTANILNWILTFLIGRFLTPEEFANYIVFVTLLGLLSVPANALATTVSRYYAFFLGKNSQESIVSLTEKYRSIALTLGLSSLFLIVIFNDFIQDALYLPSNSLVLAFAPVALFLFIAGFYRGILKGNYSFGWVGIMLIVESLTKVMLILLGALLEITILPLAIISLPIAWFIAAAIGLYTSYSKTKTSQQVSKNLFHPIETYFFMANSFIASIGMMLMNSIDILLVKHFFSSTEAGTYAFLSLFGKILYFGAGSFIELFIPFAAKHHAQDSSDRKVFFKLLSLVLFVGLSTLVIFLLFPSLIIQLFLGTKGLIALPYFMPYMIATTLLLFTNCFNAFSIAKKNFKSSYLITFMALIQGLMIFIWHDSLWEVINVVLATQTILLTIVILMEFMKVSNQKTDAPKSNLNLTNLFINKLTNIFKKEKIVYVNPPKNINGYQFLKAVDSKGISKPHWIGIYKKGDQKVIAKIWHGKTKNISYYALKHEAAVYQNINQTINHSHLPNNLKHVSIPKFILLDEKDNTLILLTSFVKGKLLRTLDANTKVTSYLKAKSFMQFIGDKTPIEQKSIFGSRSFISLLLLFPLLLGVSIIRQPKDILRLLSVSLIFLKTIPLLYKNQKYVLVHRDLHHHNILIDKNRIYIIDLQGCVFSYPEYEFATSIPIEWNEQNFRTKILKYMTTVDIKTQRITSGLLAHFVIHGLTANNLPQAHIDRYKKVLSYINTGNLSTNEVK